MRLSVAVLHLLCNQLAIGTESRLHLSKADNSIFWSENGDKEGEVVLQTVILGSQSQAQSAEVPVCTELPLPSAN